MARFYSRPPGFSFHAGSPFPPPVDDNEGLEAAGFPTNTAATPLLLPGSEFQPIIRHEKF
jgi:hypothetical protein